MMFANAADALLQKDPSMTAGQIRGANLYDAILKNRFVASQGKIVIDGYGLKDGHFAVRNLWGKPPWHTKTSVLLLDSWAKTASAILNPDVMLTDYTGTIRWKFNGDPILFMGNTSIAPKNVRPGHCPAGMFYTRYTEAESAKKGADGSCDACKAGFYIQRDMERG